MKPRSREESALVQIDSPRGADMGVGLHTRSARESSSWPIRLLFFLQRATLPSMKSKNRPSGIRARAAQRLPWADGGPRQYRIDEKTDMMPQRPRGGVSRGIAAAEGRGRGLPFSSVMRSARCSMRIMEKWPDDSCSSFFCLSMAGEGSPTMVASLAEPLAALVLGRLDIVGCGDGEAARREGGGVLICLWFC